MMKDQDQLALRRLKDTARRDRTARLEAERRALRAEDLRSSVFNLAETPLTPPDWKPKRVARGGKHREALILFLSDLHMGEVISKEEMGGRNSFNKAIARRRLERLFQSVVKLGTIHWSGPPPEVIYLVLGGDLISGEIHDELAKTNDLLSIPAVKALTESLIAGIQLLLKSFACPINVISVPGNHGRTTRKPEAKAFALNSYDTLVAWSLESWFTAQSERRLTFSAPASGDALVNIMGWNVLFTHGDRIGSRGGTGFIGSAATAARGMKRLVYDYAGEGIILDTIIMGHFHTPVELEEGFVNGTLAGPSEYSRSGRMGSHPASQWLLTVHPIHGIARRWKIQVGDPSEGSIYKGRAP
jgi:predicted phosphodiesterase